MTDERSISEKVDRVETIIATLEDGDISLERAQELRDEGEQLLAELRTDLEGGDATISEHQ